MDLDDEMMPAAYPVAKKTPLKVPIQGGSESNDDSIESVTLHTTIVKTYEEPPSDASNNANDSTDELKKGKLNI